MLSKLAGIKIIFIVACMKKAPNRNKWTLILNRSLFELIMHYIVIDC